MEEEKLKEIFKESNLTKINVNYQKNLQENIEDFLVSIYGFDKNFASEVSKKVMKNGLVFLSPNGEIPKTLPKGKLKEGSKVFISEKFLEPFIKENREKLEKEVQKIEKIDLDPKNQKHLEDVLKEQIEAILKTFFDVIEKDKNSEYKLIQSYAKELDQKIKNIIETKKVLENEEINEIIAYLNSRAAYYNTLETAKMFAKMDLNSKNKMLSDVAKNVLDFVNKKDMNIEEVQGLNLYVMQRSRYDYMVENCFLYAEKELREEKDEQKIQQAREVLNILSKDEQSPEEIIKLNAYLNEKELESVMNIVGDLVQKETNEFNKNYIQGILEKIKQNQPLTVIDLTALRAYYFDKVKDLVITDGLKLLEARKDDWAKTTAEKIKNSIVSPYEIEEIYNLVKNSKKLDQKQVELQQKQQITKEKLQPKDEILSIIEILAHKANEIQDEKKLDQILSAIEKAEQKLTKIEKIQNKKLQDEEYKKVLLDLKRFL